MSVATLATHTATFSRPANTADAMGGLVRGSYSTLYTDVVGSLQPMRSGKREEFQRQSIVVDSTFYTNTAISLKSGDKCVIGSTTYEVKGFDDQAGRGRVYAAYLQSKD